jgi:cyclopropane fatty-acyl-phospholipid synthase-like methyltransferase
MASTSSENIEKFYDQAVIGKLRGFVEGNARVEKAWQTIKKWSPESPQRILEVGCGIGDICWRMSRYWKSSQVMGVDISPKSVEIAQKLFGHSQLSFSKIEGTLTKDQLSGTFDLIVLMDVYEHVSPELRNLLHEALRELRSDEGKIILTVPTPRFQNYLRCNKPENLQPIDEDISIATVQELAEGTDTEIFLYKEVGAWHQGDYTHIVLGKRPNWARNKKYRVKSQSNHQNLSLKSQIKDKVLTKLGLKKETFLVPPRPERLALVHEKLGFEAYPTYK